VPKEGGEKKNLAGAAGRAAVALLRTTGRRAKLGGLHLPIALHPHRQESIEIAGKAGPADDAVEQPDAELPTPPMPAELRALRSRLAGLERRNARLRYMLQQERLAAARAQEARRRPGMLIDHLVSDLAGLGSAERGDLRNVVTSVLAAYGFAVDTAPEEQPDAEVTSAPGFDRRRTAALVEQLLAMQPEIGSSRYVQATLDALGRQGTLSLPQLSAITGMTSPMARRRLRLTVEGLCAAGAAYAQGGRYGLVSCWPAIPIPTRC
jgi:hypothetical protein